MRFTIACGVGRSADTRKRAGNGLPKDTGMKLAAGSGLLPLSLKNSDGDSYYTKLEYATDTKIIRFKKIVAEANPFDERWTEYFEEREGEKMLNSTTGREKLLTIWRRQERRCPVCGDLLTSETGFKVHTPEGKNSRKIIVHPECHTQLHSLIANFEPGSREGSF